MSITILDSGLYSLEKSVALSKKNPSERGNSRLQITIKKLYNLHTRVPAGELNRLAEKGRSNDLPVLFF